MNPLVDTHCHLQAKQFDEDRALVLEEALNHLAFLVVIGDDLESSRRAVELSQDRVYATVGMHPYSAKDWSAQTEESLRALCQAPQVKAIGEIGLDYYNEFSPRADQARAFKAQLELANALRLPVAIHNRQADEDCYGILAEYAPVLCGCIIHCFGSDAAMAERFLDLGFYISFAGNVTYPKAEALRAAAEVTPLDRILVETDAPYLAPQKKRGKRCLPHHVEYTAEFLASLKGIDLDSFNEATTANARAVYRI